MEVTCKKNNLKRFKCICRMCHTEFMCATANGTLCSDKCRRERKHQMDAAYRATEHGQATRRKNRKSPITIATRKRYEQTLAFKESKHRRNKIYMKNERAIALSRVRKLNYYYRHFSSKYNLYNPQAHISTFEEVSKLYSASECFYCKKQLTDKDKTVDHKIPVSKGGTNDPSNLVISCSFCNSAKSNKTSKEYMGA